MLLKYFVNIFNVVLIMNIIIIRLNVIFKEFSVLCKIFENKFLFNWFVFNGNIEFGFFSEFIIFVLSGLCGVIYGVSIFIVIKISVNI